MSFNFIFLSSFKEKIKNYKIKLNYFTKKLFYIYLRYELSNIKNIEDCIKILKYFETTDNMFENIIYVFNLYPPTDKELQTLSLLFQKYFNDLTINGFAAITFWLIVIQWINEYINLKKI